MKNGYLDFMVISTWSLRKGEHSVRFEAMTKMLNAGSGCFKIGIESFNLITIRPVEDNGPAWL